MFWKKELCHSKKWVKQIVTYAYESVPFYRSYMLQKWLLPSDSNSVTDLHKLPLISKKIILKNPRASYPLAARKANIWN